ncbi:MAG: MTH938/NDUFAF3 family protein [Candidatus Micrarchaeia archaeon]
MIEEYEFGRIVINGKEYTNDVIMIGEKVHPEWWRERGHFLQKKDLGPILETELDTLVVGTGHDGAMRVGRDVREYCREKKIELIELKSGNAVKKYNAMETEGAALAIHLTC